MWGSNVDGSFKYNEDLPSVPTGNYTLTVTDHNDCSNTKIASVTPCMIVNTNKLLHLITIHADAAIIQSSGLKQVTCPGGSDGELNIVATGSVSPYTFSWVGNEETTHHQTNLSVGQYTVIITDSFGCHESHTLNVGLARRKFIFNNLYLLIIL